MQKYFIIDDLKTLIFFLIVVLMSKYYSS